MSAATSAKKVFLIGPGFIGWNLLELLVKDNYEVTTLARRKDHAQQLQASGAKAVVIGSLDDRELLTDLTTQHDIIVHTASADDAASAEAVCEGLKKRAARGQNTIYLHTSGTSVIGDAEHGGKKSPRVYHDDMRKMAPGKKGCPTTRRTAPSTSTSCGRARRWATASSSPS